MKCQHCNGREANTHIKKNINGKREEMYLCSECANELGVMDDFRMPSVGEIFGDTFLGNFLGAGVSAMNSLAGVDRCPSCGSSFNDIVKSGRIGCADCYERFADKLEPSIKKIHGKAKHIGKFITYTEDNDESVRQNIENELDSLKQELRNAVNEQRFEDAAVIRDKIAELEEGKNE